MAATQNMTVRIYGFEAEKENRIRIMKNPGCYI